MRRTQSITRTGGHTLIRRKSVARCDAATANSARFGRTRIGETRRTALTTKSTRAVAREGITIIETRSTILTRIRCAHINECLTIQTRVSRQTAATETVNTINTRASIPARIRSAFVEVGLTVRETGKTGTARTSVSVDGISAGVERITARRRRTFIDLSLTDITTNV